MFVAYTLLLATLMPSFSFYEAVKTSSECQTLKQETIKIKCYSYQIEFRYVPGSHSSALWNECIVLKALVTYMSELVLPGEKMTMCIFKTKTLPEVSKYKFLYKVVVKKYKIKRCSYATVWRAFSGHYASHKPSPDIHQNHSLKYGKDCSESST